jgi:hypothetical protein
MSSGIIAMHEMHFKMKESWSWGRKKETCKKGNEKPLFI